MPDADDAWLIALGAEVSDGRPVEWEAAERRAVDSDTRRVVAELRRPVRRHRRTPLRAGP